MYLFSSKKGAGRPLAGDAVPRMQAGTALEARPARKDEGRSCLDSSMDLKQGLDVVELDDLPDDLFDVSPCR